MKKIYIPSFIYFQMMHVENDTYSYTRRPEKYTLSSRTSVYTFKMEVTPPPPPRGVTANFFTASYFSLSIKMKSRPVTTSVQPYFKSTGDRKQRYYSFSLSPSPMVIALHLVSPAPPPATAFPCTQTSVRCQ